MRVIHDLPYRPKKGPFSDATRAGFLRGVAPRVVKADALRVLAPPLRGPPKKVLKHFASLDRATPTLAASRVA